MGEYFKKYTGGLALMFSVLFLLIGLTKYDQIFTEFKSDTSNSFNYVKTAIFSSQQPTTKVSPKFNFENDGEIMQITENKNGSLTYHYRELIVPELRNNYDILPKLELEILHNGEKEMLPIPIYKINRDKGSIYFLLKIEKNHQTTLTNIYTGTYAITLIE
jgi:hypothetical protein